MLKRMCLLLVSVFFVVGFAGSAGAEINDKEFAEAFKRFVQTEEGKELIGKAAQQYFTSLRQKAIKEKQERERAELERYFKNPIKVEVGDSPVKGNPNAKITIVEFSDFECPFCRRAHATMQRVLEAYPNDVKLVYKHFPLEFHRHAMSAAKASMAAHRQGKFWEMHDALFENQQNLGEELYVKLAKDLGLDVEKFKKDMNDPEIEKAIKKDIEQGKRLGITGTPGFFVNGVPVKGAYPFEHFKSIIDKWLEKLKK